MYGVNKGAERVVKVFFNAEAAETQRSAQRREEMGGERVFNPVNPMNPMFIISFAHKNVMIRNAGMAGMAGKCFGGH